MADWYDFVFIAFILSTYMTSLMMGFHNVYIGLWKQKFYKNYALCAFYFFGQFTLAMRMISSPSYLWLNNLRT